MEVNNAFLHDVLTEEIYMKLPHGFQHLSSVSHNFLLGVEIVCRLRNSIYGLKQAPRVWNHKLATSLLKLGFSHADCHHSLFTLQRETDFLAVIVYVDDILVTGNYFALIP